LTHGCGSVMFGAPRAEQAGTNDLCCDGIVRALEGGQPVTVTDVTMHFMVRVLRRLEKLRVRGVVVREGRGGAHLAFTYRLVSPERVEEAISEKGGGLARRGSETRTAIEALIAI
jgi:hypothetical protein